MFNIVQVFAGTEQADAYRKWWVKAQADTSVGSRMQTESYCTFNEAGSSDWERSVWMCDDSVLTASFAKSRRSASLCLFSLNTPTRTQCVAKLIRFVKSTLVIKYGLDYIDFVIADSNSDWLKQIDRKLEHFKYGIQPNAAFNPQSGEYEDMHMYQLPTSVLYADGRRRNNYKARL